jgi:hypothetical protein
MYLGIDFLIGEGLDPYVVDVNVGLPGGAQEYDLTHRVFRGTPSDVFSRIEACSKRVYGLAFKDYLRSLAFIPGLKLFKLWMDGEGPFPADCHPALRLEDKWVQYQVLSPVVPMPETLTLGPSVPAVAFDLLARGRRLVLKRRLGRGGRGLSLIGNPDRLAEAAREPRPYGTILQEHIDSKAGPYTLSVRAVAFGGEFICAYASLALRPYSNHGILAFVTEGERLGLSPTEFETERFDERSWEAGIWFGEGEPAYLRHNLYEDEVARAAVVLPSPLAARLEALAVRIERVYEGLDMARLPRAWFEEAGGSEPAGPA